MRLSSVEDLRKYWVAQKLLAGETVFQHDVHPTEAGAAYKIERWKIMREMDITVEVIKGPPPFTGNGYLLKLKST